MYKCLNDLIDTNYNFISFKDVHTYNTRSKNNICLPSYKHKWSQQQSVYHYVSD